MLLLLGQPFQFSCISLQPGSPWRSPAVLFFLRPYISTSLEPIYRLPLFSDHADRTHQDVIAA